MNCPACNEQLKTVDYESQEVELCLHCGGMWFDEGQLPQVVDGLLAKNEIDFQTIKEAYRGNKFIGMDKNRKPQRRCPRCNVDMKLVNYFYDSNVIIDKCPSCNGIWTNESEVQAIAKYIKGNPDMDGTAKALVEDGAEYQRSTGIKGKIAAVVIALFYLGSFAYFRGYEGFFKMMLFLIWPLGFIFFGQALGDLTGVTLRLAIIAPVVTKPTPGGFVVLGGWALLLLPIILGVLRVLGAF